MGQRVFLAHASPDAGRARALLDRLRALGCEAVLDADHLLAGDAWDDALLTAQRTSAVTTVLLSPHVHVGDPGKAYYLKEEIALGVSLMRDGGHLVVPIELAPVEVAPYGLNRLHRWRAYDDVALDQVARELTALLADDGAGFGFGRRADRIVSSIPRVPEQFTGRDDLLTRLETADAGSTIVTQTLAGLGGIGKSTLAAHYARTMGHAFEVVWWIRAETPDTVEIDLDALAVRLGLGGDNRTDRARAAIDWLQRSAEPWLLVFDNAVDPAVLGQWMPRGGHGQVLVTTRNRNLTSFGATLDVGVLDDGSAQRFLSDRVRPRNPAAADADVTEVVHELQGLPLALAQAAAWVARSPRRTWPEYLDLYRRVDRDAFPPETTPDEYTATATTTWHVSIDAAAAEAPVSPKVLAALSYFAPDDIPLDLVCFDGSENNEYLAVARADVEHALDTLHGYSLIDLTADSASVHRLVQRAARVSAHRRELGFAARRLITALPEDVQHRSAWDRCNRLAPHVLALADLAAPPTRAAVADVAHTVITIDEFRRPVKGALPDLERLGRIHRDLVALLGEDDFNTVVGGAHLAQAYRLADRAADAIPIEERVVADFSRRFGDGDPRTITARAHLAASYRQAGRRTDALGLLEQIVSGLAAALGEQHPDTISARALLSDSYIDADRFAEAKNLRERVLADRIAILGEQHPDTISALACLAATYHDEVRLDEAIRLKERVLTDRTNLIGEEHPDTISAREQLAHSYLADGRLAEAIHLQERVLTDRTNLLSEHHPDTISARAKLAVSYHEAGRHAEAVRLQERVLTDRTKLLGEHHGDTITARAHLAVSYFDTSRLEEAIRLQEQVLADRAALLGDSHPDTITARAHLVTSYLLAGSVDEAVPLAERVLVDRTNLLGEVHHETIAARAQLADSYRLAGRLDRAVPLAARVLGDRTNLLGETHPDTIRARANLAAYHRLAGHPGTAIPLEEHVLADRTNLLGETHPDTIHARANLAASYGHAGRTSDAISLGERACTESREVLGESDSLTHSARANLAFAYRLDGRDDEAVRLLMVAIDGAVCLPAPHPFIARWREWLAEWTAGPPPAADGVNP